MRHYQKRRKRETDGSGGRGRKEGREEGGREGKTWWLLSPLVERPKEGSLLGPLGVSFLVLGPLRVVGCTEELTGQRGECVVR